MDKSKKSKFPYQIVIVDILIFILMIGINVFSIAFNFFTDCGLSETANLGLYLPLFIMIFTLLGFYLFVEYKFNHLKLNKIFLAFAIAIALSNLISVLIIPNHVFLPNNQEMDITPFFRTYSILWGFVFALFPIIFMYLFPRRVNSRGYVHLIYLGLIGFSVILILTSFILDKDSYAHLFENGFFGLKYEDGIKSFLGHHNLFGYFMLLTIMVTIALHIRKKNWKWSLYLIPLVFFLLMSTSKICIALGLLVIFIHLISRVVLLAKKSKDNLIITLLIFSFIVLIGTYVSVMMSFSTAGILYDIKTFITNSFESAGKTLESRSAIWSCSFQILNTNYWSYIFGFGGLIYPKALCLVYGNNPGISEQNIYWAHNGVVELICQGGIILLLIYAALYVYLIYAAIKIYKKQPLFSFISLLFIFIFIVRSMFESSFLFGTGADIVATLVIAIPVLNEYCLCYKKEQALCDEQIKQAKKLKKVNFKSKILSFNKKCLILEAKYIAYDLNTKIKL